jgi:cytochrome c-type protein NapC
VIVIEPGTILVAVILITIALIVTLIFKPELTLTSTGKILAFLSLFIFPILAGVLGTASHMEHSKTTEFCLSCHEMTPFGKSLHIDDSSFIPASHFQNIRVPRKTACFTCHTNYTMYGDLNAKLEGLHHVYVHYLGTVPLPKDIRLYRPYSNRECLHCHLGARTFEEGATHNEEPDRLALIKSNKLSCLSSGCHESVHNIAKLNEMKFWEENVK